MMVNPLFFFSTLLLFPLFVVGELPGDGPLCVKKAASLALQTEMNCLQDYKIEVVQLDNPDYYLRSSPEYSTVFLPAKRRTYQLHANPQLCNTSFGPNGHALFAIVLHELNHILDYTQMNQQQLAELGIEYSTNYSFLIWYEHRTDHKVLELQYGDWLSMYREWIYTVLPSPEAVCTKKLEYYTPPQIASWILDNQGVYIRPCANYTFDDGYPSDCGGVCHFGTNCSSV